MSHKVHPVVFRLGINTSWRSKWFSRKKYQSFLREDVKIREFIEKKLTRGGIDKVEIERSASNTNIKIHSSRPGLIIGRGGSGIEELKKDITRIIAKERNQLDQVNKIQVKIEIEEIRQPEAHASIMAAGLAEQLEKRIPYRRAIKQTMEKIRQSREVQGVRISVSGRLNGADIARTEWLKEGKVSLQTLRANVDYSHKTAFTTYGTVGVKIWIYKGEKFE